jgi:hypothetical protein
MEPAGGLEPSESPYSTIFHQIDPHVLKHTRQPISSASLGGRIGKAKSSRSLLPFPCILPTLSGRESIKLTQAKNKSGFYRGRSGTPGVTAFELIKRAYESNTLEKLRDFLSVEPQLVTA